MMIKVCGITWRADALAAVDAGASALGFIFYPHSPRYVTPERAAELGDGLPVWKVGVFVDETPANVELAIRSANLDVVQIYGGSAPVGARVWKAFRATLPGETRASASGLCEAILLDSAKSGATFDWRLARGVAEKVIIAGGLDASNVREAIRLAEPWGVDASSRLESAPGVKDHTKVRQFVKAAQETS
jgi:phosphoribosylanthranilate isomerase